MTYNHSYLTECHNIFMFGDWLKRELKEVDIYSLQLLMGHADLQVLRRYLKQTEQDTWAAHVKGSPVDKLVTKSD